MIRNLLLLGAAFVGYQYYKKQQALRPAQPTSQPAGYKPGQPSQKYPWSPITPPRVDNSNQPWYVGVKNFASNPQNVAMTLQAGSSVVHSLSDIWGSLSPADATPGTEATANLVASADDMPSNGNGAYNALAGQASDQSDIIGGEYSDNMYYSA